MKNSIFARFACAFFIFWHFEDVLVLSTTWNDLFCSCVDDVSICWHMFNFVFLCPNRCFQINSRAVRRHFSSIMTLNNWKMIAEKQSYIFKWRSRFRRCHVCLSSLLFLALTWRWNFQYNYCETDTLRSRLTYLKFSGLPMSSLVILLLPPFLLLPELDLLSFLLLFFFCVELSMDERLVWEGEWLIPSVFSTNKKKIVWLHTLLVPN